MNCKYLYIALFLTSILGCKSSEELVAIPEIYQKPFKYISSPVSDLEKKLSQKSNGVGNIIVDEKDYRIIFESRNDVVGYTEIDMKALGKCNQKRAFSSDPILLSLGIEPSDLELARKVTHSHRYYDHVNKLKVVISCDWDGGFYTASFSQKYYLK